MSDTDPTSGGAASGEDPASGGAGSGEPTSGGAASDATYSQQQVDTLLATQRRRNESKVADYEAMKARITELEARDKTDLERAQSAAQEAQTRAAEALNQRNRMLVTSAVTSAAVRAGALDPDVVVALLADSMSVTEAGEIDGDVERAVTSLLESKPFLKNGATSGHGSADGGSHGRSAAAAATPSQSMDELFRKAR